jgi:phytoene dehydrogenase-like protein
VTRDVVVIGAGHNGLIAGCYLAAGGLDVEVVERDTIIGGAVSTVERWPGVRVDRGSSLHVMIRHTGIIDELALADLGLEYADADPFCVAPMPGRPPLVLFTDLDRTCAGLAADFSPAAAEGYRSFIDIWRPRWQMLLRLADATGPLSSARSLVPLRRERRLGLELSRQFLTSADAAIGEHIADQRIATAIAWWAAQAGPAPHLAGTAPTAGSIALMHLAAPGRPIGGSGRLSEALRARLESLGGTIRLGDAATGIETSGETVTAVRTANGDRIPTRAVVAACHARTTFELLDLPGPASRVRIGDGIGLVLRLLTDAPPSYDDAGAPADRGMTMLVHSAAQLRAASADALTGRPSRDPPLLAMTPTIADPTLAPPGRHVTTLWSQWAPYHLSAGGWDEIKEAEADRLIATAERWAPGLTASVEQRWVQTPLDLERELRLPQGDVMHLATEIDTLFGMRPLPGWGRRTPVKGLFLAGASTHPGGGVWGASGRAAATAALRHVRGRLRRRVS